MPIRRKVKEIISLFDTLANEGVVEIPLINPYDEKKVPSHKFTSLINFYESLNVVFYPTPLFHPIPPANFIVFSQYTTKSAGLLH